MNVKLVTWWLGLFLLRSNMRVGGGVGSALGRHSKVTGFESHSPFKNSLIMSM